MSVFGTKSKWGGVRVDKRVCWQEKLEDEAEGMAGRMRLTERSLDRASCCG